MSLPTRAAGGARRSPKTARYAAARTSSRSPSTMTATWRSRSIRSTRRDALFASCRWILRILWEHVSVVVDKEPSSGAPFDGAVLQPLLGDVVQHRTLAFPGHKVSRALDLDPQLLGFGTESYSSGKS